MCRMCTCLGHYVKYSKWKKETLKQVKMLKGFPLSEFHIYVEWAFRNTVRSVVQIYGEN